jgi:hypothetical protein
MLRRDWNDLAERLGRPLLLDFDFADCLMAAFAPPAMVIARLGNEQRASAFAVLQRQSPFVWRTAKLDNAPLGLWLIDPTTELEGALRSLIRTLPGAPGLLSLVGLDPALASRPPDTPRTRTIDYIPTPAITIDRTFESWFSSRSKNLRHNLRRQARGLAEDGVNVTVRYLVKPEEVAAAVAGFAELEAAGWKSAAGTAVAPGSPQERFYRELLKRFSARGEAKIWQIFYDDSVAACDLCLTRAGVTVILKTAYSELAAGNRTSPAQLLRRHMFETLFSEPNGSKIEFFGPVKPWHKTWTAEQRQLYHLNHFRWGWLAELHTGIGHLRAARNPQSVGIGSEEPKK